MCAFMCGIGMCLLILLAIAVWLVWKQNETMKREKDLMEFMYHIVNMMKQENNMILSRAMNENRELRNSTRKLLSDIENERKKSAKRENRRKGVRGDNSRRGQRSWRKTRTGKQEFEFFNLINTMLTTVGSVLPFVMKVYKLFKK